VPLPFAAFGAENQIDMRVGLMIRGPQRKKCPILSGANSRNHDLLGPRAYDEKSRYFSNLLYYEFVGALSEDSMFASTVVTTYIPGHFSNYVAYRHEKHDGWVSAKRPPR
jgi:hypothetical protein